MSGTLHLIFAAAWHSLLIYALLVLALRLFGRPLMAQFTLLEYFVVALLGSAVETGLYAGSGRLLAGLTAAAVLLLVNHLISLCTARSRRLRRLLIGEPLLLVRDGAVIRAHLRRAGLTEQNLLAGIRERGYDALDTLRYVVLEVDGSLGVVPR